MSKNELFNELLNQVKEMLSSKKETGNKYAYSKNLKKNVKNALDDLEENHNNSWAVEIFLRNIDNLDAIALSYRGHNITYLEMFTKSFQFAKSLNRMGYKKGSEIPVCVTNIPEFVEMLIAISFIGAKINSFGEWFDEDYTISILNKSNSDCVFISDEVYSTIKEKIDKSNIKKVIIFSLTDSLLTDKNNNPVDVYDEFDSKFYKFENKIGSYKDDSIKPIFNQKEFLQIGIDNTSQVIADCNLDDDFAITYTSGTTDPGIPKAVLHSNRSYLTLSRFKESDVSGMPSMRNMTVLGHIPTYTHMELSCAISDTLFEKCTLALEPIYNKDFFPYAMLINKPNFAPASVAFYGNLCKKLNYDPEFKNINLEFLMIPTITGEGMSAGEEKFFNYTARKHKFGTAKLPFPLSPVTFSIGGGTSESSGIFVTLFKSLQEKKLNNLLHKNTLGLTPLKFADLRILDENGDYCKIGEPGLLVGRNPCDMKRYYYPVKNSAYITDKYGNTFLNLGTYAYQSDSYGRIKMKGRPNSYIVSSDGTKIPEYVITDIIMKDTKNIMSCSLVKVSNGDDTYYVCHLEFQPNTKTSKNSILDSCAKRLVNKIPGDIIDKLYFRVRSFEESFPAAPSGKRDTGSLVNEGITDKCEKVNIYLEEKNQKTLKKNLFK